MPVINITGSLSPHSDDTVTLNGRLDPTNSTWMKVRPFQELSKSFNLIAEICYRNSIQISDSAMVLEEQPGKLAEAFRLFLQGEGYGKC